ncbi:MAG: riboflavin kinase [Patescibacteria group bacterium]
MHNLIICGHIEKGEGIAKGLGCPTANITVEQGILIPGLGVYIGEATVLHCEFPALVCINDGRGNGRLKIEVHLLGAFMNDLNGEYIEVRIFEKLRDLEPWNSEDQIRGLILKDIKDAHSWFVSNDARCVFSKQTDSGCGC